MLPAVVGVENDVHGDCPQQSSRPTLCRVTAFLLSLPSIVFPIMCQTEQMTEHI
jgi:hypothetical protein